MTEPAVSIVIPARDAASTLPLSLAACRAQAEVPPLEIVVVDDGSTDDTAAVAERLGARVIRQAGAGPAAARNRGWREARAPVILFTDSDCVPHPDWVHRLAGVIDAATPVAGGSYGIANAGHLLADTVHAEIVWRHARLGREVEYFGSFNFGARREALESVGGFDASYEDASGEDSDLCYRLRDAGHRIRFVPEALVDHHHPTSLVRYLREQSRHGFWRVVLYGSHPGRVRGDGYAGPFDFVAPPLAALSVGLALGTPFVSLAGPTALIAGSIALLLSTVLAARVALHVRSMRALSLAFVATLRAYARAWGMTKGVVSLVVGGRARRARS